MLFSRTNNEKRKYELILEYKKDGQIKELKNIDIFGNIYNYIKPIFEILWNQPYLTAIVLSKSKSQNVKDYLANFFVNNFYEDILINNNKNEQLLYVITILLDKEIENLNKNMSLNNQINKFLNDTPCGYMLYQFCYKKEVQNFFRLILLNIFEKFETSQEIVLDPEQSDDLFVEEPKKEEDTKKIKGNNKNKLFEKELEIFNEKYKFGLRKEVLEDIIKEMREKEDNNMLEYLISKLSDCCKDSGIFATNVFLESINFSKTNTIL